MKRIVFLVCGSWIFISSFAQTISLAIATDKTTSLIFPFPVRHVDRGTKDILVQQVKEKDNILLVKAALQRFSETNLSVVTDDGSVYSFRVTYDPNPSTWLVEIPVQKDATISAYANDILNNPLTMYGIRDQKFDIEAKVIGIYIREDVIYFQLRMNNTSPIDYDIDLLRFYIRDRKKNKRTASQEIVQLPLYTAGNIVKVKANSNNSAVFALNKFTIPDAKYLAIQIIEKNGGRHLTMKVKNSKIIRATSLAGLN